MRTILIGALMASCLVACGGVPGDELTKGEERGNEALCQGDGGTGCLVANEIKDPVIGTWCTTYGGNGTTQYPWKSARLTITPDGTATLGNAMNNDPADRACYGAGWVFGTGMTWTHAPSTIYLQPGNRGVDARAYSLRGFTMGAYPTCTPNGGTDALWKTDDATPAQGGTQGTKLLGPLGWTWTKDPNGVACLNGADR